MGFIESQERAITFSRTEDADGWGTTATDPVTVMGIVAMASFGMDGDRETGDFTSTARVFITMGALAAVGDITIGDAMEVDGSTFTVSRVDSRGVLPSRYPVRIEGVKK